MFLIWLTLLLGFGLLVALFVFQRKYEQTALIEARKQVAQVRQQVRTLSDRLEQASALAAAVETSESESVQPADENAPLPGPDTPRPQE